MGGIVSSNVYTYQGKKGEKVPKLTVELKIAEGVTEIHPNACEFVMTLKKVRTNNGWQRNRIFNITSS